MVTNPSYSMVKKLLIFPKTHMDILGDKKHQDKPVCTISRWRNPMKPPVENPSWCWCSHECSIYQSNKIWTMAMNSSLYISHIHLKKNIWTILEMSAIFIHIYLTFPWLFPNHGTGFQPHRAAWGRRRRRRLRSSAGSRPDGATACRKSGGKAGGIFRICLVHIL